MMSNLTSQLDLAIVTAKHDLGQRFAEDFISHGLSVSVCCSESDAKTLIDRQQPKVVLAIETAESASNPIASENQSLGIDLCRYVREHAALSGHHVLLLLTHGCQATKRTALLAGANDCLTTPHDPIELLAKVRNAVHQYDQHAQWRQAAMTDGLTGLWNHTQFRERLDSEYSRTRRYGGELALLMIDLDHFKLINDEYGHETGNAVLARAAATLGRMVRESDVVARYGGEEFAVICPQTGLTDAFQLAERIRRALPATVQIENGAQRVSASVGVAALSDLAVDSPAALIALADRALYAAKSSGRDCVVCSAELPPEDTTIPLVTKQPAAPVTTPQSLSVNATDPSLQSIQAIVQTLAVRDPYAAMHAANMTFYANALMQSEGWREEERQATLNAARWHDLGVMGIPDHILHKPTELTPSEYAIVRRVPDLTCRLLAPLANFQREMAIIRHLRERFDGSGYPDGLAGESIPRASRLLLIVEAFDSLTTPRPHRDAVSFESALRIMTQSAGSDFDPDLVQIFADLTRKNQSSWEQRRLASDTTVISRT